MQHVVLQPLGCHGFDSVRMTYLASVRPLLSRSGYSPKYPAAFSSNRVPLRM
jgi:hypothetical protein